MPTASASFSAGKTALTTWKTTCPTTIVVTVASADKFWPSRLYCMSDARAYKPDSELRPIQIIVLPRICPLVLRPGPNPDSKYLFMLRSLVPSRTIAVLKAHRAIFVWSSRSSWIDRSCTIGPRIGFASVSSSLIQPLLQVEHTPLSLKSPEYVTSFPVPSLWRTGLLAGGNLSIHCGHTCSLLFASSLQKRHFRFVIFVLAR